MTMVLRSMLAVGWSLMLVIGLCAPVSVSAAPYIDTVTVTYPDGSTTLVRNEDHIITNGNILLKPSYIIGVLPFIVPGKGIWWDDSRKTLIFAFTDADDYIKEKMSIKIGEKQFKDQDDIYELRQEAVVENGRVYLPVRGIAEAYGHEVRYTKRNGMTEIVIRK